MPDNHPTPTAADKRIIDRRNDIMTRREELVEAFMADYKQLHSEASTAFVNMKIDKLTKNLANYVVGKFTEIDYNI